MSQETSSPTSLPKQATIVPARQTIMHNQTKSLKLLGVQDNDELPEEVKQQAIVHPGELKEKAVYTFDIPDVYKLHLPTMEILESKDNEVKKSKKTPSEFYQLVLDIKHCIFKAGNDTMLLFSIFDDNIKQFITEEYCLNLSINNFPKIGQPEDCKVLFKNLTEEHLKSDIYVVCRIYREGPMDQPDITGQKKTSKKCS